MKTTNIISSLIERLQSLIILDKPHEYVMIEMDYDNLSNIRNEKHMLLSFHSVPLNTQEKTLQELTSEELSLKALTTVRERFREILKYNDIVKINTDVSGIVIGSKFISQIIISIEPIDKDE